MKKTDKNICVIGAGYVGLAVSILLSQHNKINIVDCDQNKVKSINQGISPINNKLLQDYLTKYKRNIEASCNLVEGCIESDYILIATPTDYDERINNFDTNTVVSTIDKVCSFNKKATIIIKSTVPVGFTENINKKYYNNILYSPEFLRENSALHDNLYPDRIIVSSDKSDKFNSIAKEFAHLLQQSAKIQDIPTYIIGHSEAEAVKLFSNTYLALRISFFNELDTYAKTKNLNCDDILKGVCQDKRIGDYYNKPSFGFGGYCLPKDTKQLLAGYDNIPEKIIKAVIESNKTRIDFIIDSTVSKINELARKNDNVKIGIYKLTMLSNPNSYRHSPSIEIMNKLKNMGHNVVVYDPEYKKTFNENQISFIDDLEAFKQISDIIITDNKDDKLLDVSEKIIL